MTCPHCGTDVQPGHWPFCPHESVTPRNAIGIHPKDQVVVYRNPKTGQIAYPGRTDVPMPERYRRRGYEEYRPGQTLHDLDRFCKEQGVMNEKVNYNSGNGVDTSEHIPEPTPTSPDA